MKENERVARQRYPWIHAASRLSDDGSADAQ